MADSRDAWIFWAAVFALAGYGGYKLITEKPQKVAPAPFYDPYPKGPIAEISDGTVWNMVWASVKGPRTRRLAWVRADHAKNRDRKERETLTLYQVNCETTGFRTLTVINYSKDGKVLDRWGEDVFDKDFEYAPPGSIIENVVDGACLPRFDSKQPLGIPPPVPIK